MLLPVLLAHPPEHGVRCGGGCADYNRPDFHPDDRDTTELVERWRAELFGDAGTLNDKLITAA